MRDEIQAGLKNAVERGFTIEEAIQSFISAGYNPVEVKEAANTIKDLMPAVQQTKKETFSATKNITNEQMSSTIMKTFTTPAPFSSAEQKSQQIQVQKQSQEASAKPAQNIEGSVQLRKKSPKKWIILLIVLLILILGFAGILLYLMGVLNPLLSKIFG